MTLNKEQLVEKLTDVLKEADPALFPYIESIATEAIKRAKAGSFKGYKSKLVEYFDNQMETLKSRLDLMNIPQESILKFFLEKRVEICLKMEEVWKEKYPEETIESLAKKGIYLGIPIVPANWFGRGYNGLMSMVRNGDKVGCTILNPSEIENIVEVPKAPYFIYDVESGRKYLGKSPEDAEILIKEDGRFCLTAEEGIMLCALTNTLSDHYVDCTGSRYIGSGGVPGVCLHGGVPGLDWDDLDDSGGRWGSASCRSRD